MATQAQVFALIKAAVMRDQSEIRKIGEQIQADLVNQGRHPAAREVGRLLNSSGQMIELRGKDSDLIWWEQSTRPLQTVFVSGDCRRKVLDVIRDNQHVSHLVTAGVSPRRKVMLRGPSGTGKTSLAKAIAHELARPLGVIRLGTLIDSHMGTTGSNLDRIWNNLTGPSVLLFDEWDAIGTSRGGGGDAAGKEANRIVATLLTLFDRLPLDTVLVAATNLSDHCDTAFNRRFDCHLEMELPGDDCLKSYARELASTFPGWRIDTNVLPLGHSYATAEQAVLNAVRDAVLAKVSA